MHSSKYRVSIVISYRGIIYLKNSVQHLLHPLRYTLTEHKCTFTKLFSQLRDL